MVQSEYEHLKNYILDFKLKNYRFLHSMIYQRGDFSALLYPGFF